MRDMETLRMALREEVVAARAAPASLPVTVTMKTRQWADWEERERFTQITYGDDELETELEFYREQRHAIAFHFWPGMAEWLRNPDNVTDYFIARGDDRRDEGRFELVFHFATFEEATLFKLRWK